MIHNNQSFSRKLNVYYTANRIWDRSIFSSIKPKSDDQFFLDLYFCTSCELQIFFWFWFVELKKQFQAHNLYKTCKSTKNRLSNFGLSEEIMDLSRILLSVKTKNSILSKIQCFFLILTIVPKSNYLFF